MLLLSRGGGGMTQVHCCHAASVVVGGMAWGMLTSTLSPSHGGGGMIWGMLTSSS